jgi:ribosomal protein S21
MLIVKLDKNKNIEKALKLLKSKVIKTRQSSKLVERKEYEKKSVKKSIANVKKCDVECNRY